jgi:hypothetical protein
MGQKLLGSATTTHAIRGGACEHATSPHQVRGHKAIGGIVDKADGVWANWLDEGVGMDGQVIGLAPFQWTVRKDPSDCSSKSAAKGRVGTRSRQNGLWQAPRDVLGHNRS